MPRPTFSESTIGIIGMFEYYAMIYFAVTFWGEVVGWGGATPLLPRALVPDPRYADGKDKY